VNLVQEDGYHLPPGLDYYWATSGVLNKARVFTQEVRAHSRDSDSRFSWVVGAFYSNSRNLARERDLDPNGDEFLMHAVGKTIEEKYGMGNICDNFGCDLNLLSIFRITSRDLAAFGEFSYRLTDRVKVAVGARQTRTRFSFYTLNDGPAQGRRDELADKGGSDAFTPKFNISFQANANNLFYGTVAKGFRGGGGNSPLPHQTCADDLASIGYGANPTTFNPDTTWSYEIGAKSRLFDGALAIDSSIYRIKWENMQTRLSLPCAYSLVLNTGDVTTQGFEAAINALIGERFSVNLGIAYMHGEYTGAPATPPGSKPVASVGDRLTDPDWKIAAGVQYHRYFGESRFVAQLDYALSHIADAPTVATNPANASYDPDIPRQADTHLFTARTGIQQGNLDVSLFVFNLLNNHDVIRLYHRRDTPYYLFTSWKPRTWTLRATYHF
jgi:iron complex outermembrane receptor protein